MTLQNNEPTNTPRRRVTGDTNGFAIVMVALVAIFAASGFTEAQYQVEELAKADASEPVAAHHKMVATSAGSYCPNPYSSAESPVSS